MSSCRRSDEEIENFDAILDSLPSDLEQLTVMQSDPDRVVRRAIAWRLRQMDDEKAVEPLLRALEDQDSDVRIPAALFLGHYESEASVSALIDHLLHDPSGRVRHLCAAFGLRFSHSDETMDAMAEALKDSDEHVRSSACWLFAHNKDTRAMNRLFDLLDDPVWRVRLSACRALIDLGIGDIRIVQTMEELRKQPKAEEHEAMVADWNENCKNALADYDREEHSEDDMSREELEEALQPMKTLGEILEQAQNLLEKPKE